MKMLIALFFGYGLGSIPFGLILTQLFGAGDLRQIGSGNIGATNVLRTGRKGLAAATLVLDAAKGFCAVYFMQHISGTNLGPSVLAAVGAMIGHCFPVWLGFKGGKGVATLMGVCLALSWPLGAAYAVVWVGVLATMRISSLAGISAAVATPVAALIVGRGDLAGLLAALAGLVAWNHRENIARLRMGTEPRVGQDKADVAE
ncbi:MAG: glycerol-3-phosphate 1-O-acyltransferase [Pseudomonadota bacterium]|jgi:glycerol-3-phosphate acyltransferase PlsY